MKHVAWGLLLAWLESVDAFNLPRPLVYRLHGLHSTTNGPHRRNNWERAFSQFSGQHQWHHRRTKKNQVNSSDDFKQVVHRRVPRPEVRGAKATDDTRFDIPEATVSVSNTNSDTFSWAPLVAEIENAKDDRNMVLSNSTMSLQAIELSSLITGTTSTASRKAESQCLENNMIRSGSSTTTTTTTNNSSTKAATTTTITTGSSADSSNAKISHADSSTASSRVQHRPADYAWAAMDVWHMECALHHARSAAAEDEVPIGAVLVAANGSVLARTHNLVHQRGDPTAHAELLAVREAALSLCTQPAHEGSTALEESSLESTSSVPSSSQKKSNARPQDWRALLNGSTLYCTLEPCAMCLASLQAARIGRVVYGAPDLRLGAVASFHQLLEKRHPYHPNMVVESGLLANTSAELLRDFFKAKRAQNKVPHSKVAVGRKAEATAAWRAKTSALAAQPPPWAANSSSFAAVAAAGGASPMGEAMFFTLSNSTAYQPSPLRFVDPRGKPVTPKARTMPPLREANANGQQASAAPDAPEAVSSSADASSAVQEVPAAMNSTAAPTTPSKVLDLRHPPAIFPSTEQNHSAEHYATLRSPKGPAAIALTLQEAQVTVTGGAALPYPWSLLRDQQRRNLQLDAQTSAAVAVAAESAAVLRPNLTEGSATTTTASKRRRAVSRLVKHWMLVARARVAAAHLWARAVAVPFGLWAGKNCLALSASALASLQVVAQAAARKLKNQMEASEAVIALNARLNAHFSPIQKKAVVASSLLLGGFTAAWASSEALLLAYALMA